MATPAGVLMVAALAQPTLRRSVQLKTANGVPTNLLLVVGAAKPKTVAQFMIKRPVNQKAANGALARAELQPLPAAGVQPQPILIAQQPQAPRLSLQRQTRHQT